MTNGGIIPTAHQWLSDAMDRCDGEVLMTSPFFSVDICRLIAEKVSDLPWRTTVVTNLDPAAVAGGYQTVQGLKVLLDGGIEVRHVDRLHAKCFIIGSRAMLGSANLTGAGLGKSVNPNRELGIALTDEAREQARSEINSWPARIVTPADLDELESKARTITAATKLETSSLGADTALQLAERLLVDARDGGRGLWVKLEYGEPALDGWRQPSYFASPKKGEPNKGRPNFKPGDLVLICAQDTHDCYAVVEVTSEPEFQPDDFLEDVKDWEPGAADRWPWITRTKPRLVPDHLMELKLKELDVKGQGLQNGHVRLKFDQFTAGVRALARLATE